MSLYEQLKKENARCLKIDKVGNGYLVTPMPLEKVKAGKEPEKKHTTLDYFFEE